jgi:hypothetical protein
MGLRVGSRLRSTACDTEVVVVRAPSDDVELRCGGHAMVALEGDPPERSPLVEDFADGTLLGKRYGSEELGLELLVTKPGAGSLSVGDTALGVKEAKTLPSSD